MTASGGKAGFLAEAAIPAALVRPTRAVTQGIGLTARGPTRMRAAGLSGEGQGTMEGGWRFPWGGVLRVATIVGVMIGALMSYPVWNHHDTHLDSPIFADATAAERWTRHQHLSGPAAACVPASVVSRTVTLAEDEGFYTIYKCNTRTIYWKIAALFLAPFAAVIVLAKLAFRRRG